MRETLAGYFVLERVDLGSGSLGIFVVVSSRCRHVLPLGGGEVGMVGLTIGDKPGLCDISDIFTQVQRERLSGKFTCV